MFCGVGWVGFVGMETGTRQGKWSVSLNYRQVQKAWAVSLNLWGAVVGSWPIGFLVRRTLHDTDRYQDAVEVFRSEPLMAPCYLTLCGAAPLDGLILERSRGGVDRQQSLAEVPGRAVVVTNIDVLSDVLPQFDFTPGSGDMSWAEGDSLLMTAAMRRQVAVEALGRLGNAEITAESAFKVLGTAPVVNDQTVYSCVMQPAISTFTTRVILDWGAYASETDPDALVAYEHSEAYLATREFHLSGEGRRTSWLGRTKVQSPLEQRAVAAAQAADDGDSMSVLDELLDLF